VTVDPRSSAPGGVLSPRHQQICRRISWRVAERCAFRGTALNGNSKAVTYSDDFVVDLVMPHEPVNTSRYTMLLDSCVFHLVNAVDTRCDKYRRHSVERKPPPPVDFCDQQVR